jgi:hypothetical protein
MTEDDVRLLGVIRARCEKGDGFFKEVIHAGMRGLEDAERYYREMAADMETMASVMVSLVGEKRVSPQLRNKMSDIALSKLEKYNGKTFLNWSHAVDGAKNI